MNMPLNHRIRDLRLPRWEELRRPIASEGVRRKDLRSILLLKGLVFGVLQLETIFHGPGPRSSLAVSVG